MRMIVVLMSVTLPGLVAFGELADELEGILQAREKPPSALDAAEGLKLPEAPPDFPGETTRVVDPYAPNAPNPLFLTSLPDKLWWDEQAEARLPVLVTEPVGLTRLSQPVSVTHPFPAGTVPESLRVVTPYGQELPSQVRVVDADGRLYEVAFVLTRLDALAQMPLFVYYGSKPVKRASPAAGDPCLRIEERERGVALANNQPVVTLAVAGKGKVIYIAPRFGPQAKSEHLGAAMRRLAEHVIGYVPVRIDLAGAWTTVLTDGERYVISAFNDSDRPCDGLTLVLRGLPPILTHLVSLRTGRSYPIVEGKASGLPLLPRKPDDFMMAPSLPRPKAYVQTAKPISQSLEPGMKFLNLPRLPSGEPGARGRPKE